ALIMGSKLSHVVWSPLKVLVLIESIAMSCVLILGLFMTEAIFSIFSVKSVEMVNVLTYGGRSACQYPIDIYPRPLKALFTIVAPFALTLYVQASWILGKPLYGWPMWTAFVTPLSGAVIFTIMIIAFNLAMRHYKSTGN
ncbi:MAG: ABC-2 family transporter protein, partial [Lachnospiraceae bacterium]|nr:ABC-2 family transporter protein [Lachnospiraceae bacterium]